MQSPDDGKDAGITSRLARATGLWREIRIVGGPIVGMQILIAFCCFGFGLQFVPAILYAFQPSTSAALTPLLIAGVGASFVMVACDSIAFVFKPQGPASPIMRAARAGFMLGGIALSIVLVLLNYFVWLTWYCGSSC